MLISCLSKCCWLLSRHLKYNRFHPGPLAISSFVEPMRLKGFSLLFCLYKTFKHCITIQSKSLNPIWFVWEISTKSLTYKFFHSFSSINILFPLPFNNSNQGLSKHSANICHSFDMPIRSCQKFVNLFCSPIFFCLLFSLLSESQFSA